jgi:hypothetical protein
MQLNLGRPDRKNETFMVLNIKSMVLIVPAIVLGHYLDEFVDRMKLTPIKSVTLQTFLNVFIIYVLHKINQAYTSEFQLTLAGLFFSALFFGMQTNYLKNLKTVLQ